MTATEHGRLLERTAELQALREAIARVDGGAVLVVEGAGGIGKSELIAAGGDLARASDLLVLRARASQLQREFPFGVVRQLLEPVLRGLSVDERSELLSGAAALAEPVLSERPQPLGGAASPDAAFAAMHGLYWLCVNLAERAPLLIAVDDLHWADAPSMRYIALLASRLAGLPIVLLCATRPAEEPADAAAFAELFCTPSAVVVRPRPLSEAAVGVIVAGDLGPADPEFVSACHAAVAGNPFLLAQLLAELRGAGIDPRAHEAARVRASGPRSVSRAMLARLAGLPHGAARLASAVAVLGDGSELRHAAALAGTSADRAAQAADALARAELFTHADRLEFVHPIVRQAVYGDIGRRERALEHRRAAGLLAAEAAAPESLAVHLVVADPIGDAATVRWLREAAEACLARGDPATAARYLSRALQEPPAADERVRLLRRLGSAELLAADPAGLEHLEAARELTADRVDRADIALELVRTLTMMGEFRKVEQLLRQSLAETEGIDRELTLLLEAELAGALQNLPNGKTMLAPFEELGVDLLGATPAERLALACRTTLLLIRGSRDELRRTGRMALGDGRLLADQGPTAPAIAYVVATLTWAEDFEPAKREAQRMLELSRRTGSIIGTGLASLLLSWLSLRLGDVRRAEEQARDAVDGLQDAGFALGAAVSVLVDVLVERDQLDVASAELAAHGFDGPLPEQVTFGWLIAARGRLHAARGDFDRAVQDLLAVGRRQSNGLDNPAVTPWRSEAALAKLRLGDRDEAVRLAEEELGLARAFGAPRPIGVALRARGLCREGTQGLDDLREAVDVLERSEDRLEHARALVDLGASLRRANRRAEARTPLRQGLEMALRCGATALADRAMQELEASGARARKVVPAGIDALTASERRVCQLAADGRTNREIAQALFVTLRTVETHLTAAYRKLDVSARHELRAALGVDTGDAPARVMRRDRPMENEPHEQESAGVPPVVA